MEGRSDLDKYKHSLHELTNAICFKHGGVYSRPGTHFVAEVKTSAKRTRLIPFEFSVSQAYIIEMGDGYMRFYKEGGRLEDPPATPVEIVSPYAEADLFKVTFAQSADVLYMACQGYAPQKLERASDISWSIGAVSFTSSPWGAGPYPGKVALYQSRSWWANTTGAPDTIWGSQTNDYENLDQGTGLDDEGVQFTLSANKLNAINGLIGQNALLALTAAVEHFLSGGSPDEPITPSNPNSKSPTSYGSGEVAPLPAGNAILFLQRSGRKLREIASDPNSDSYVGPWPDLSVLAEHMTQGGIVQMAYQQELDSIVWMVRADGALIGMTYERPQDVVAFHRHIFGGSAGGIGGNAVTDALCKSVAVIPHPDGDQDQTWVIVERTIDGAAVQYVEYLDATEGLFGALQVDSGLLTGQFVSGATTITGLDHLEGQTVDILALPFTAGNPEPAVYPQQVVSGGEVTGLDPPVYVAEVGLHFESTIITQRPSEGADDGTAQGGRKRINKVTVRLKDTVGVTINGDRLEFRTSSDAMTSGLPLFTGDKEVMVEGWDQDARVTIMRDQPLPLTVLAIIYMLNVGD